MTENQEQTRQISLAQLREWVTTMHDIYGKLVDLDTVYEGCRQAERLWQIAEQIDDEYIEGFDVTK